MYRTVCVGHDLTGINSLPSLAFLRQCRVKPQCRTGAGTDMGQLPAAGTGEAEAPPRSAELLRLFAKRLELCSSCCVNQSSLLKHAREKRNPSRDDDPSACRWTLTKHPAPVPVDSRITHLLLHRRPAAAPCCLH